MIYQLTLFLANVLGVIARGALMTIGAVLVARGMGLLP